MKPYKRIFNESSIVKDISDLQQIVDISNLEWSKYFEWDWNTAQLKCPKGWRLPTVQELFTADSKSIGNFNPDSYWSSSEYSQKDAWCVGVGNGMGVFYDNKLVRLLVRYVREN